MTARWKERWKSIRQLGGGGQGSTFLVEELESGKSGVLKTLRKPKSKQARRRMFLEVNSLKALATTDCKVPSVIDDNVAEFENPAVELYLVMEHIEGTTLQKLIEESGAISLEAAISLAKQLAISMSAAHNSEILHRDIKPANLIVSDTEPWEITIVDFGLSFNSQDADGPTEIGELIDNQFLSLPERRVHGGNKRDARSDIVGVAGVLFYCLTSIPPVDLRDDQERAPHRRENVDLSRIVPDDLQKRELASFFDRAFSVSIEARFQRFSEFLERLESVAEPKIETPTQTPAAIAAETKQLLLAESRPTQLALFGTNGSTLMKSLARALNRLSLDVDPFQVSGNPNIVPQPEGLTDTEPLPAMPRLSVQIQLSNHHVIGNISYLVMAERDECVVYRCMSIRQTPKMAFVQLQDWAPIFRFPGNEGPDSKLCEVDLEACIGKVMVSVRSVALGDLSELAAGP